MKKEKEAQDNGPSSFCREYLHEIQPDFPVSKQLEQIFKGTLLFFRRSIPDDQATIKQAVKYLATRRVKGQEIPSNILLISQNSARALHFLSADYLPQIEDPYEKNYSEFQYIPPKSILYYGMLPQDREKLYLILEEIAYTKINLDENCIVGWATAYYKTYPSAKKGDFLGEDQNHQQITGEIRNPEKFSLYINPYLGENNLKFQYLMDKLNHDLEKKNLGAFYTPPAYAEKSLDLLRIAIERVPEGNDYIILDRCAGTGNLILSLNPEELRHCVLSTVEYYEYKVLLELFAEKVRHITPPFEDENTFQDGLVAGADALSQEFVENPLIQKYIQDPHCTIILFENPPYAETTSMEHQKQGKGKKSSRWKESFLLNEMRKQVRGVPTNDLANVFIWSAFQFYLRQPTDSYIVLAPVKYWKAHHLIQKKFLGGYAFNRRHFHTKIDACIMVALWSNEEATAQDLCLTAFDLNPKGELVEEPENVTISQVSKLFSKEYYDKRTLPSATEDGILLGLNGLENKEKTITRLKPIYSPEMLGYLVADSVGFDNPDAKSGLLSAGRYNGNGFFLHKDNYLEKLPLFSASRYVNYEKHWTARGQIMKSGDGAEHFHNDVKSKKLEQILLKNLLFSVLEPQNHMRSFHGSDNRYYRNQLCFDTSNGDTLASRDISGLSLNFQEKSLFSQWELIFSLAKLCNNYDKNQTYGIFQIIEELNTKEKGSNSQGVVYDYPQLQGELKTLKKMLRQYYLEEIVPFLFEYQFLK